MDVEYEIYDIRLMNFIALGKKPDSRDHILDYLIYIHQPG